VPKPNRVFGGKAEFLFGDYNWDRKVDVIFGRRDGPEIW